MWFFEIGGVITQIIGIVICLLLHAANPMPMGILAVGGWAVAIILQATLIKRKMEI